MAIGDKKKKLFNEAPAMPPQPKRCRIQEAEGGFIVECGEYGDKQKVAKTLSAAMKLVKAHFGSEKADEDEDE